MAVCRFLGRSLSAFKDDVSGPAQLQAVEKAKVSCHGSAEDDLADAALVGPLKLSGAHCL